jgi:hypothetical protein
MGEIPDKALLGQKIEPVDGNADLDEVKWLFMGRAAGAKSASSSTS